MDPIHGRRFTETLRVIRSQASQNGLTLQQLLEIFGPQGHGFLTLFLVLPFLQPIPLPGISTIIGLAIALVGFFMLLDRPPWLPARFARVVVESNTLLRVCGVLERLMRRLETLVKPRAKHLFDLAWFRRVNGFLLCFHALVLALPLPIPFTNFFPALVLLLISLGTLEEDAVVIGVGYAAILVNAVVFSSLVLLPWLGIRMMAA